MHRMSGVEDESRNEAEWNGEAGFGDGSAHEEQGRRELLEAVRNGGFEAVNFEEAWGRILGVQAKIALDAGMGSKATTAAKFLKEIIGEGEARKPDNVSGLERAGVDATRQLLELIREEKGRRGENTET